MRRWPVLLAALVVAGPAIARLGLGGTTGPTTPNDVTLPVSSTPVGAVGADAYTGWTNPAGTAADDTSWTSPSTSIRYLKPTDAAYSIATTADSWRDVEVTTWVRNGCVLLRYAGGVAVYFIHFGDSANGTLSVGVGSGYEEGGLPHDQQCPKRSAGISLYENSDLVGTVPGYSKTDTAGDTFTFGCSGWECYAEFNGTEFWRGDPDIRIPMEAGKVALSSPSTGFGFRNTTVDWLPLQPTHSIPSASIFDMRDFGFYAVETTGSITSGSDELTVASSAGYVVGDDIIVECGTEAGACARNTVGVGGLWPAAHYANDAAMDAAVPCTAGSYAYLDDTGKVRRCNVNGANWYAWDSTLYYTNYKVPRALSATITAINGNVLTLDTTASATATNARVFRDSTPELSMFADGVGNSAFTPIGEYRFPARVVLQGEIDLYLHSATSLDTGVTVRGAGLNKTAPEFTFFAPDGSPGITLTMGYQADCVTTTGVYIRNNTGLAGFGLNWTASGLTGNGYPSGVKLELAECSQIVDSGALDSFAATITSYCTDCDLIGSYARITEPQQHYVGWQIQQSDAVRGTIVDAHCDSDYVISGVEMFRSDGVEMTNPTTRNCQIAANSSGQFLISNPEITVENDSYPGSAWYTSVWLQVSKNVTPPSPHFADGGTISNPMIDNDFTNGSSDFLASLQVESGVENIEITGTYPTCSSPVGLISYPAVNRTGGACINVDGEANILGIRCDGSNANATWGDVRVSAASSIIDSVADNVTGSGTETDVITNSAYGALCP